MFVLIGFVVLAISFFIGCFAFPQIVGSLQRIGRFSLTRILVPIVVWTTILIGCILVVHNFLSAYLVFFYFGFGVALLFTLKAGFMR